MLMKLMPDSLSINKENFKTVKKVEYVDWSCVFDDQRDDAGGASVMKVLN